MPSAGAGAPEPRLATSYGQLGRIGACARGGKEQGSSIADCQTGASGSWRRTALPCARCPSRSCPWPLLATSPMALSASRPPRSGCCEATTRRTTASQRLTRERCTRSAAMHICLCSNRCTMLIRNRHIHGRTVLYYGVADLRLRRPICVQNGPLCGLGGPLRGHLNEISMRHVLRT